MTSEQTQMTAGEPVAGDAEASPGPIRRAHAGGGRRGGLLLGALAVTGLLVTAAGVVLVISQNAPAQVALTAQPDQLVTRGATLVDAHDSPSLALDPADPATIVVADKVDRPRFLAALHVSRDAGRTWAPLPFPTPKGQDRPYAPDLVWTRDGVLHLSFSTLTGSGNSPDAVWLTTSRDAGATWATPRRVLGPYAFQVRLAAAPSGRSLFLTWLQADATAASGQRSFTHTGLPVMAAHSVDGGATWGAPTRISPEARQRVGAAVPQVLPGGGLAVLYYDYARDRRDFENLEGGPYDGRFSLVLARADESLSSVREAVVDDAVVPAERFLVYLPPYPSLAVDPESGRLFVAWSDGRHGDRDVFLRRSDDGRNWSEAVQVNPASSQDQYLPNLTIAPTGRLDLVYLDRRDDPSNVLTAVTYAVSANAGNEWSTLPVSSRLFPSDVGPGSETGRADQGTRLAVASERARMVAAWTDARGGTVDTDKLDIWFGSVTLRSVDG